MLFSFKALSPFLLKFTKKIQALKIVNWVCRCKTVHCHVFLIQVLNLNSAIVYFLRKIPGCHVKHVDRELEIRAKIKQKEPDPNNYCEEKGDEGFFVKFSIAVGVLLINCTQCSG